MVGNNKLVVAKIKGKKHIEQTIRIKKIYIMMNYLQENQVILERFTLIYSAKVEMLNPDIEILYSDIVKWSWLR